MKITVLAPDASDPKVLERQLVQLQDRVNNALKHLGFDYSQRLNAVNYPEGLPMFIPHNMPQKAWGLKLVYLRDLTDDTAGPVNEPFVDWIPEADGVRIRAISGLTPTHQYEMRFIAYA